MSAIEFYGPNSIPEEVLRFWRERQLVQDRFMALTAGPEWFSMMAERDGNAVVAVVRDSSFACKAVLPLVPSNWSLDFRFAGHCLHRRRLSVMRVNGGDLIEDGVTREDLAAVWRALAEKFPASQGVWLNHVGSEARSSKLRLSSGDAGCFVHKVFSGLPHYRHVMPATLEECLRSRSPKSIRRLREKERALCRFLQRDLEVVEMRKEVELLPHQRKIEALMNSTWQARELGHLLYANDLANVARRHWLRSFLLLSGENALAFVCGYQGMGVFVYEQVGYDQQWSKFSPGTILLYRLLEKLYQNDTPACLDFGEGEAEYKRELKNDTICIDGLLILRRSLPLIISSMLVRGMNLIEGPLRKIRTRFRRRPGQGRNE
jgi:hypothetical protein